MRHYILLFGAMLLALSSGFLLGRIIAVEAAVDRVPLKFIPDTRPLIPVAQIEGIVNGKVQGRITGDLRLFLGEKQVIPGASGAFEVAPDLFTRNVIEIRVPEGSRFVASRRGKKYYPVDSAAGSNLTPKNRIYFKTAEEAEKAGFTR